MDKSGGIPFESGVSQLTEAIRELSRKVKELQQGDYEETERLRKFEEDNVILEFTLVTSGLIKGEILWIGSHSLGVKTSSGRNVILYKHAIAFVQEHEKVVGE